MKYIPAPTYSKKQICVYKLVLLCSRQLLDEGDVGACQEVTCQFPRRQAVTGRMKNSGERRLGTMRGERDKTTLNRWRDHAVELRDSPSTGTMQWEDWEADSNSWEEGKQESGKKKIPKSSFSSYINKAGEGISLTTN